MKISISNPFKKQGKNMLHNARRGQENREQMRKCSVADPEAQGSGCFDTASPDSTDMLGCNLTGV